MARFTSMVAIIGIAAGVASLIVALALARGFADEMRDKILANTAHVSVFSRAETNIANWREIKETLEREENASEVSATSYESSIIVGDGTANYAILKVQNSPFKFQSRTDTNHGPRNAESKTGGQTQNDEEQNIEVSVGEKLAEKINAAPGETAELIILENGNQPRRARVFIAEIFQTGLYDYDSTWVLISPENFALLHNQTNFTPSILAVSLKDIYKARETAERMQKTLGDDFRVVDWQQANQPLFAALSLERKVSVTIISLIIFIAALNITTTLALLVNERKLDIAVLRMCGARTKSLILIFLFEGLYLSFPGIFFGVVFGLAACFLGNRFKFVNLSEEVYSLNHIPFHTDTISVLSVILTAFALCLAATIYPAFKASRVKPLENLRTQ